MFDIHELTAAPHFPEPLRSAIDLTRPESLVELLIRISQGEDSIDVRMRNGEIFIALTPS